jgi:hypothetical protein
VIFPAEFEHAIDGDIDDIKFAEEMFLVLFVYLSFTDEDVIKGFLYEHVEDVVLFVFKQQIDETSEEFHIAYLLEDAHARYRDAVA